MLFKSATSRNIFSTVGLGVVTTIGVAATLVGLSYGTIRGAGIDKMQTAASDAAAEVNRTLSVAHEMVAGLDYSVSALRERGIADRDVVMAVLTKTLEGFPGAIGLSTGWEPNAFDQDDDLYAGQTENGYDASGRFMPWWYRDGGQLKREPLEAPKLVISDRVPAFAETGKYEPEWLEKIEPSDFWLEGYEHHAPMTAPMAV